jgi:hypothetical protein
MEIEAERKRNDSNHGNETGTIAYSSPNHVKQNESVGRMGLS